MSTAMNKENTFSSGDGFDKLYRAIRNKGLKERIDISNEYYRNLKSSNHMVWSWELLSGNSPVIQAINPHTQETKDLINFGMNSYLFLNVHPEVKKAAAEAIEKYGVGSGSVPLLTGSMDVHTELENKIAQFKGGEAAILNATGFGSNSSTITTLANKYDCVIADRFAHASLKYGCRDAVLKEYKHNNPADLHRVLDSAITSDKYKSALIVVDGVYSMEGSILKLDKTLEVIRAFNDKIDISLLVDDAHATGVLGENGHGTFEHFNLSPIIDDIPVYYVGTFSKGVGVLGGYVVSSQENIQHLKFLNGSNVFSTSMAPSSAAAIIKSLEIIEEDSALRASLWRNINYLKNSLDSLGFNTGETETAIIPVIVNGGVETVFNMCMELRENGIMVSPVTFPAVPINQPRLRISMGALHTEEQINILINQLEALGRKYKVI